MGWLRFWEGDGGRLLLLSAAIAAVFVVVRAFTYRTRLDRPLGAVGWSFTDSWASMLTAFGALLGTLVGADLVGAGARPVPKNALIGLNLLFGALVLIAPLVFSAVAKTAPEGPEPEGPKYQGYVGFFLLSCFVTLWAVLGELGALVILLRESTLTRAVSSTFQVTAAIASILVLTYAWRSIKAVIEYRSGERVVVARAADGGARMGGARWSLL
jgi:hypothetical protein